MENPIDHRDLEGVGVKLVDSSAVAQAKPSRSGFSPFERQTFCSFLIFKNGVFLPVIVNEFKFVYLASFCAPARWPATRCHATPPVNLSCTVSFIPLGFRLTFLVLKVAVEKRLGCQERVTVRPGKVNQLGALV